MKKTLLLIAAFSAAVIALTSCNSNSGGNWNIDLYGSVETALYGETYIQRSNDGIKLVPAPGTAKFPELQTGKYRQRIMLEYYEYDEYEVNSNKELPVELISYIMPMTEEVIEMSPVITPITISSEVDHNSTIFNILPLWAPEWEGANVYGNNPALQKKCVMNYLDLSIVFFAYQKNAESKEGYAVPDFSVEFDSELIPGVKNDTIRMVLNFDNKKHEEENVSSGLLTHIPVSIDIESLRNYFNTRDQNDENITYIIKLEYQAYEKPNLYDPMEINKEAVSNLFVTTEWTPNKPYFQ